MGYVFVGFGKRYPISYISVVLRLKGSRAIKKYCRTVQQQQMTIPECVTITQSCSSKKRFQIEADKKDPEKVGGDVTKRMRDGQRSGDFPPGTHNF